MEMRDLAILCAALAFVFGVIGGVSITQYARPIVHGARTHLVLTPTCSVIGTESPVLMEARR